MYNVENLSNRYYLYDSYTNKEYLIGEKDELIAEYASQFRNPYGFNNTFLWSNIYDEDIAMSTNDVKLIDNFFITGIPRKYSSRRYFFYDAYHRIIDIRIYRKEAVKLYSYAIENGIYLKSVLNYRKYKNRQWRRKWHSGNTYHHKGRKTYRTERLNSINECKKFVRGRDKEFPDWWDDTTRRISCCWKDQNKDKKQWEHNVKRKKCDYVKKYEKKSWMSLEEEMSYLEEFN